MTKWATVWLPILSNLVLVGVTAWYAVLTKRLATSARDSAKSSERAAEAAAKSVAVAVASVNVEFEVTPWYWLPEDIEPSEDRQESLLLPFGVQVECTGATVFLHGAVLLSALIAVADDDENVDGTSESFEAVMLGRIELDTDEQLPKRVHNHETIAFRPPREKERAVGSIAVLHVLVRYSLDGSDEVVERSVEWYGRRGVDYETGDAEGAA